MRLHLLKDGDERLVWACDWAGDCGATESACASSLYIGVIEVGRDFVDLYGNIRREFQFVPDDIRHPASPVRLARYSAAVEDARQYAAEALGITA